MAVIEADEEVLLVADTELAIGLVFGAGEVISISFVCLTPNCNLQLQDNLVLLYGFTCSFTPK